jgi:hypothetical protein
MPKSKIIVKLIQIPLGLRFLGEGVPLMKKGFKSATTLAMAIEKRETQKG